MEYNIGMFDSLLLLTYGGPETVEQIRPFIEKVLGDHASPSRIEASVARYERLGGVSPINEQSRALLVRLVNKMMTAPNPVPVYWATLYSNPSVEEIVAQMAYDDRKNSAVFIPTPLESEYMNSKFQKAIDHALAAIGTASKPAFTFLPSYASREEFICCGTSTVLKGLKFLENQGEKNIRVLFSAHSLPVTWAETSSYDARFGELIERIANQLGLSDVLKVWQSKPTGAPGEWLGPNPVEAIENIAKDSPDSAVLLVPLGFSLDNMEIAYDLDYQAAQACKKLGLSFFRAPTASAEPEFVDMIINLLNE